MKKLKMITEANYNVDINEASDNNNIYIQGIFASAETKNQNGRIYSKSVLEREHNSIMESVKNKNCLGELGHPTDRSETALDRAAIMVEDMWWDNTDIYGKAKVLNTPHGMIARNLIKDGCQFGISTRGLGTVSEETNYVNDDYTWLTVDLVQHASNPNSRFLQGVLEGKEFNIPSDSNFPSYDEVKQFLVENNINYDPAKISELISEGYSLDQIKDYIIKAQDIYEKEICQFLESIK